MKRMKLPSNLSKKMEYLSECCDKHAKPIRKMVINGNVVCPRCFSEQATLELEQETAEWFEKMKRDKQYLVFYEKSLIEDRTLLQARFNTYITECQEEIDNKRMVWDCLQRYKKGQTFNLILQGKQGTGKSHLAYSTLHELNEERKYSCLFISVDALMRKIKESFNNKNSKYTEEYFNELLSTVDFLVLDDLGAETGAIDTDKKASDFVQRILYGVTTVRQDKSTIVTTNLDGKTLFSMYDKKLISRILKNPRYVIFKDSKDKRLSNLPF